MFKPSIEIKINDSAIGLHAPTYFIADVAANHDGDIERAKDLIYKVAEAGGNAAKFQHFAAKTIVSDKGFKSLGGQQSHQAGWKKSVYEVYNDASVDENWTPILKETCDKAGIDFFTSPYSYELVDSVDPYVPAYKVGSGDITWPGIIEYMGTKNKPILIATGASTADDVYKSVAAAMKYTSEIVLMQCNTNYTGSLDNMRYINLNVLKTYAEMFPQMILGLSDHTPGHATVLGAITLGARVVEKHFTDSTVRVGPDHGFSMDPKSWREMVDRSRELEAALGTGIKKVEDNEKETVVLQRRAIRASMDLKEGTLLDASNIEVLRPCPAEAITPYHFSEIVGKTILKDIEFGDLIKWSDLR